VTAQPIGDLTVRQPAATPREISSRSTKLNGTAHTNTSTKTHHLYKDPAAPR